MTEDITIKLNTVERSIARRAVYIALDSYNDNTAAKEEAQHLHRLLDAGTESSQATKAQWNHLFRILSYSDVRAEIGKSRTEYLRSKLIRRVDDLQV